MTENFKMYRSQLSIWLPVVLVACSTSFAEAQNPQETGQKETQTLSSSLREIAFYNYDYNSPWDELRLDTLIVSENDENLRLVITPNRLDDSLSIWEGRVHAYTFEMRLLENDRVLFDKSLTLQDFNMDDATYSTFPEFIGYQPEYDELIFEQSFFKPETDAGARCFYTIKTDGTVNLFGFDISDYSENYEYVLTKEVLYGLDGSSFSFFPALQNMFINDSCFISINRIYGDQDNAIIYNVKGDTLQTLKFDGFVEGGEDLVPLMGRIPELSQLVLFDRTNKNVRVIRSKDPLNHIIYQLSEIAEYEETGVQKESLIAIRVPQWYKDYQFYFNAKGELIAYFLDK